MSTATVSSQFGRRVNRRNEPRTAYTTVAVILPATGPLGKSEILRCTTRDLSLSGACLISEVQLPEEIVLQLLLPDMEDKLLRAKVVSHRVETVVSLAGRGERHIHGVRFAGFVR